MPTYTSRRSGIDLRTMFPPSKPARVATPAGRGWALMGGDRGKWHFIGTDSRSLCGKWAEMSRNILDWDVHLDNQCAGCRRKFEKLLK
jgi:hypothetical protein